MSDRATRLGYVVIGRNEGERLARCLASLPAAEGAVVYVDSGSSDASVATARRADAGIVELSPQRPFTAARGRNEGFARLMALQPATECVMFIDGDCELAPAFPAAAARFLETRSDVAAVCGMVREKRAEANIYARLCDIEWDGPAGDSLACGGIAMMRVSAFREAGGFNEALGGGEEPELCIRLRERGWKIWRLDAEMATHDAAISRFGEWFRRVRRGGRAFAEVSVMHRRSPARIWVRETRRALVWAGLLPAALLIALFIHPAGLLLIAAYPAQIVRLATIGRKNLPRRARDHAWSYGLFMTIGKFGEAAGIISFVLSKSARPRTD